MKYALIIGNNQYTDPKLARLNTPAADAQALANVLSDQNIGSFDKVISLVNKTESHVSRGISTFLTNKKPEDLVLVYFSGHGILDDRGRLFLALKDTRIGLLKATAIPAAFISDEMDSCRSRRQILILDCCNSGAFARGTKGEQKAVTEATFEGSGFGRVVLTASDATQFALEGDQVIPTELSLFTHFLLEGLKTGAADTNNDGHISLDEWYDYTYTQVLATTPKQIPNKWSYRQQGDLIIAKNPFVKKKVVELPADLLQLLESPYSSVREGAVKELGRLLSLRNAEMAQLVRSTLEKMEEDDSRAVSQAAVKLLSEFKKSIEEREAAEKDALERAQQEAAEMAAREKVEKETSGKARLEAEELAKQKATKERAEREAAEKVALEKSEKEAAEKTRLETEEQIRQKAAKEKAEREAAKKLARDKVEKDAIEKARLEAEELAKQKAAKEKAEREVAEKANQGKRFEAQKPKIENLQSQKPGSSRKWNTAIIVALIGLVGTICAAVMSLPMFTDIFSPNAPTTNPAIISTFLEQTYQALTPLPSLAATETFVPTETTTQSSVPSETTAVATSLPTEITDAKGVSMMLVPAGEFSMGIDMENALAECHKFESSCPESLFQKSEPAHIVFVDTFYIDKYEVTNQLYANCVAEGVCDPPQQTRSATHEFYYGNSKFDNYPVIYVDWYQAKTYCEWRGTRLPTEAEWEKAARGTDGRTYPWGNEFNGNIVNFCDKTCIYDWANKDFDDAYQDVAPIGSYPGGVSPYGAYDMAGNVFEWVSSLYGSYPYNPYDGRENLNVSGNRILRGGAFHFQADLVSTYYRAGYDTSETSATHVTGFRCARDANP